MESLKMFGELLIGAVGVSGLISFLVAQKFRRDRTGRAMYTPEELRGMDAYRETHGDLKQR